MDRINNRLPYAFYGPHGPANVFTFHGRPMIPRPSHAYSPLRMVPNMEIETREVHDVLQDVRLLSRPGGGRQNNIITHSNLLGANSVVFNATSESAYLHARRIAMAEAASQSNEIVGVLLAVDRQRQARDPGPSQFSYLHSDSTILDLHFTNPRPRQRRSGPDARYGFRRKRERSDEGRCNIYPDCYRPRYTIRNERRRRVPSQPDIPRTHVPSPAVHQVPVLPISLPALPGFHTGMVLDTQDHPSQSVLPGHASELPAVPHSTSEMDQDPAAASDYVDWHADIGWHIDTSRPVHPQQLQNGAAGRLAQGSARAYARLDSSSSATDPVQFLGAQAGPAALQGSHPMGQKRRAPAGGDEPANQKPRRPTPIDLCSDGMTDGVRSRESSL